MRGWGWGWEEENVDHRQKAKNLKTPERKCNTRAATVARNKSDRNGSRGVFRVETMKYRLLTGTCVTRRTEKQ